MRYNSKSLKLERDNWKEYFFFYIYFDDINRRPFSFPGYVLFKHYDPLSLKDIVAVRWWFTPIYGIYIGYRYVRLAWFDLAIFCYRKKYFKSIPKESERITIFWFKHLFK